MNIRIETIPHDKQRYPTAGDWFLEYPPQPRPDGKATLVIRVSALSDWRREFLVAVHELIEAGLCQHRNITQDSVDAFDKAFEKNRKAGDDSEPGDDPKAPYRKEHFFATNIEALLSAELDVNWQEYEKEIEALP